MSKRLNIQAWVEIEVRDKNGKLIEKRKFKSHSWVSNFLHYLRAFWYQQYDTTPVVIETIVDKSGTSRNVPCDGSEGAQRWFALRAPVGNDGYGLLLGTGTSAVSPDDYKLASQITEGTGVDQMNYSDVTVEALTAITNGYQFRVIRTATNNSGADITVNEIGLVVRITTPGVYNVDMLIARDVLGTPVTVPAGSTITVRYIISFTV